MRPNQTWNIPSPHLVASTGLQHLSPVPGVHTMRTDEILYTRTLDYYDDILVFEAKDAIGGTYVASHLEAVPSGNKYLLVGCKPENLRLFRHGTKDLRSLIIESARYGWYLADLFDVEKPLKVGEQIAGEIPEEYLPGDGYKIAEFEVDHDTARRAREQDNVVIQISIEPPEATQGYRVRSDTLAGLLTRVENLTRYTAEQVAEVNEYPRPGTRATRNAGRLEILDISHGSIKVTMQAVSGLDTNRESMLEKALEQLDHLFNDLDSPHLMERELSRYGPKVANAYIRLMRFLSTKRTGFSYTWATPTSRSPSHRAVSLERARRSAREFQDLLDVMDYETPENDIVLNGILEMADEPGNRWRLRDPEQGAREGIVGEDGPSLSNLVIDRRYRFACVEEMQATGRGRRRNPVLFLKSIEPCNSFISLAQEEA